MLILEYISTHGTPEWCECQPGRPRVPYRRMSNSVHHAQACIGSTRDQRDPLQLAEHSGDAAGIVPAIADVPGRGPSDKYISARSSDLKICLPVGQGLFLRISSTIQTSLFCTYTLLHSFGTAITQQLPPT